MFICQQCSKCRHPFHLRSVGKCEMCGNVSECLDCPPWHEKQMSPPRNSDASKI